MIDPIPTARSGASALDVARRVSEAAGHRALKGFRLPHDITVKGRGDLLTETDLAVEKLIHDQIAEEFPDHGMLSEETASGTSSDGWVWVVDPIDGTRNFVAGIPFFCVNIALCHEGEPVVGVTHDPLHNETFYAERGGGTFINDEPARLGVAGTVAESVFGLDLGYHDERGSGMLHMAHQLFPGVQSLRIPGSAALGLAYAACGRYDIFVHHYLYPWDIAAGIILLREAGGLITSGAGGAVGIRSHTVVAGAPRVHSDFLRWQEEHRHELQDPPDD